MIYWLLTDSKQFRVDCVKTEYKKLLLKMLSESWWSYSISKIQLILKIQETQQDLARTVKRESKRDSRHNRFLY